MLNFTTLSKNGLCIKFGLFCFGLMCSGVTFAQYPPITNITYGEAYASLKTNRDRLLVGYAIDHGYKNSIDAWNDLSASQKGVFLTITDYLGRRSFAHLNKNLDYRYVGDSWDAGANCAAQNVQNLNQSVYWIRPPNWAPVCLPVQPPECVQLNKCTVSPRARTDHDMALNHVIKLYAINGSNGSSCSGGQYNRIFFKADEELIYLIRNIQSGLPAWGYSTDLAGPHDPFTQSREGLEGQTPRGQIHEWAWDYEAVPLNRPGVYGIYDPHIVEMDIDYNFFHYSNPECSYDGIYGRYFYQNRSYHRGLGGPAELDYYPSDQ